MQSHEEDVDRTSVSDVWPEDDVTAMTVGVPLNHERSLHQGRQLWSMSHVSSLVLGLSDSALKLAAGVTA